MDLLTIENLCIAAELVFTLLLLAFACGPSKRSENNLATPENNSMSWESAESVYLQSCIYRALYLQRWSELQGSRKTELPFAFSNSDEAEGMTTIPSPWQDRLTGELNRTGLCAFYDAWTSIDPIHRKTTCVSMVTLNEYSHLVGTRGAMVTEQALRAVGKQISLSRSSHSLIARYQPDRFVILHFIDSASECHQAMQQVQSLISSEGFFEDANEAIPLVCVISIIELGNKSAFATIVDELDEGYTEAVQKGHAVVSKMQGDWSPKYVGAAIVEKRDEENPPVAEVARELIAENMVADAVSMSNDISAVASADEIEALFAQINRNKAAEQTVLPNSAKIEEPTSQGTVPLLEVGLGTVEVVRCL